MSNNMTETSEPTNKEGRVIAVNATIPAEANEEALAETIHEALTNDETIETNAVEIGTVDIYQHQAHHNTYDTPFPTNQTETQEQNE